MQGRKTVENRKGRLNGRVILIESGRKKEITSTELPEGVILFKRTPGIPMGAKKGDLETDKLTDFFNFISLSS